MNCSLRGLLCLRGKLCRLSSGEDGWTQVSGGGDGGWRISGGGVGVDWMRPSTEQGVPVLLLLRCCVWSLRINCQCIQEGNLALQEGLE